VCRDGSQVLKRTNFIAAVELQTGKEAVAVFDLPLDFEGTLRLDGNLFGQRLEVHLLLLQAVVLSERVVEFHVKLVEQVFLVEVEFEFELFGVDFKVDFALLVVKHI